MQRAGGDHPAPSGSGGWGDGAPDAASLYHKRMCYVLHVGLPVVSPALWTPHLPRGEVSNFGALTPALPVSLQRVRLVSEPCTLSINGVIFGLTSTDLLFHMGAEEISR